MYDAILTSPSRFRLPPLSSRSLRLSRFDSKNPSSSCLASVSTSGRLSKAIVAATAACSGVEEAPRPENRAEFDDDAPTSIELIPIASEEQFDRIIAEAQQLEESVIVLWMAHWCRKCIYLKPKLEKLAADYYPRLRFYCVDVNTVSQRLVSRAGITRMPTVQLWYDSRRQAEVIGGHKAWLIVDDVRKMIENDD
ncbi:thioredoxin-like 3-2, chloroplastic isoform X1 [Typha angustifolia]|uniref:thioredoxin-like 3-2, chloroplastic isoform X1 n=1 Tax=Typha angustifolia TaxID=59011 RepID=UPI003C304277